MVQKAITQEAIDSMREIGVGIILKRLKHKQYSWHCGSASCYAGWNTRLNHRELYEEAKKKKKVYVREHARFKGEYRKWGLHIVMPKSDAQLAKEDWGINAHEENAMFGASVTLAEQIGLIEFLADGFRLYSYARPQGRGRLAGYVSQYKTKEARKAWARQYDQPRPEAEFVGELLCQTQGKQVVEEILEVEVCKVGAG